MADPAIIGHGIRAVPDTTDQAPALPAPPTTPSAVYGSSRGFVFGAAPPGPASRPDAASIWGIGRAWVPGLGLVCTALTEDDFARVESGGWGTASSGGDWSFIWVSPTPSPFTLDVDGTQGRLIIGPGTAAITYLARQRLELPIGCEHYDLRFSFLLAADTNWANVLLYPNTAFTSLNIYLAKNDPFEGGDAIGIAGDTVLHPLVGLQQVRFQNTATGVRLRVWNDGDPEPGTWDIEGGPVAAPLVGLGVRFFSDQAGGPPAFMDARLGPISSIPA